jgi:hypothetical protein
MMLQMKPSTSVEPVRRHTTPAPPRSINAQFIDFDALPFRRWWWEERPQDMDGEEARP